jgi:hypothetical protein
LAVGEESSEEEEEDASAHAPARTRSVALVVESAKRERAKRVANEDLRSRS